MCPTAWPDHRGGRQRWRPTVSQHVRTTKSADSHVGPGAISVGFSYRARENTRGSRAGSSQTCTAADPAVAAEVAQAAQLVKGYGDVRRRMLAVHEQIVAGVLRAVTLEAACREGFSVSRALGARLRALVLQGPDGEGRVPATIAATLTRLEAGDVAGALEPLAVG